MIVNSYLYFFVSLCGRGGERTLEKSFFFCSDNYTDGKTLHHGQVCL